jgi:hypothetical protein
MEVRKTEIKKIGLEESEKRKIREEWKSGIRIKNE